jgi:hypothetical protein
MTKAAEDRGNAPVPYQKQKEVATKDVINFDEIPQDKRAFLQRKQTDIGVGYQPDSGQMGTFNEEGMKAKTVDNGPMMGEATKEAMKEATKEAMKDELKVRNKMAVQQASGKYGF